MKTRDIRINIKQAQNFELGVVRVLEELNEDLHGQRRDLQEIGRHMDKMADLIGNLADAVGAAKTAFDSITDKQVAHPELGGNTNDIGG